MVCMKILKYKKYSKEELIRGLRKVTLLHPSDTGNSIYVYKDADIELTHIPASSIMPSQFYQLEESLLRVGRIQQALREHNLDLFNLGGYVNYVTNESGDTSYDLLPVIIEYQMERDGTTYPLIVDGIHRIILARIQKKDTIQVIKIDNVNKDYPYPAYANPKGWEDVIPMLSAPKLKDKRHWRFPIEKAYNYYRNFNSVFENVGQPKE